MNIITKDSDCKFPLAHQSSYMSWPSASTARTSFTEAWGLKIVFSDHTGGVRWNWGNAGPSKSWEWAVLMQAKVGYQIWSSRHKERPHKSILDTWARTLCLVCVTCVLPSINASSWWGLLGYKLLLKFIKCRLIIFYKQRQLKKRIYYWEI